MTKYRGFRCVHRTRERLTQEDTDGAGRLTESRGIAEGSRECFLQLLRAGVLEVGELALVAFGNEHNRGRSYFYNRESWDGCAADGIFALDVEGKNVGHRGAAGVTTLNRCSNIVSLGQAGCRANAGSVVRVVSEAVESIARTGTVRSSTEGRVDAASGERGIFRTNVGRGNGDGGSGGEEGLHVGGQSGVC